VRDEDLGPGKTVARPMLGGNARGELLCPGEIVEKLALSAAVRDEDLLLPDP